MSERTDRIIRLADAEERMRPLGEEFIAWLETTTLPESSVAQFLFEEVRDGMTRVKSKVNAAQARRGAR